MGHVFKNNPKLFSIVLLSIFGVTAITSLVLGAKTLAEPAAFELTNAQIIDKSEGVTGDIVSYDNGDIKSNVALHNLNDKVTYRVSIKNTRDYDITITEIADNNDNVFLDYVYDPHAGFLIASGESFDLDIDVIYANVISDLNERSQDVSVKFTIKYDYEEEELGVPNTGAKPETDKKQGSISLFLISMLGIIVCTFVVKNSNRKAARIEAKATTAKEAKAEVVKADNSKLLIVAGLLMVPLAIATLVQTATAITSSFEFTISTMFDIKDRIEITYEVNGEPKSEIIPYGGKVEDIDQPQIPGYTFTDWTDDDGNPVDPEAPIYDDTHINPVFAVHHYSIHFNGNEATSGEMQDQQFVYDQAQTLTKNAFVKTGHNFSGWNYLDEDNNNVHYGDEDNIENLTTVNNKVIEFVAEWTPITYHIEIDTDDDNTTDIDEELKYGECYTLPTNEAVKIGYTANGWLINGVHYANVAEVCNLTTEDGGEVVVKPDYTVNHYTIHFDGNEATSGTMDDIAAEYDQEYVLPLNTFERTGFEYADWTLDGNIVGDGTTVKNLSAEDGATVTLVARWSKDVYDINYYGLEGATVVGNPTRYDVGQEVILNAPTKTGYVFIGWTGSNGKIPMPGATIPRGSTGAKNFTAHWLPISYTVHFDGNNGDGGSMQDQEFFYDTAQTLNTNNFTRTGYVFDGWNTKADKSGDNYTNEQEVNNLTAENNATVTLYARWNPIHYNVAFHKNSDSATGETATMTNITYDDSVNLVANGFSYEHYKFMGWNTAEDGTGTPYTDQETISNLTVTDGETINLYAQWKERTAMLQTGPNVKNALKELNDTATTFKRYDGASAPDLDSISDKVDIALPTSSFPVWAWSEGDNVYWWSEAEAPKFNPTSNNFFNGLSFSSIDVSGLDASSATNMNGMFANLKLTSLNLSGFDSSAAKNMGSMFSGTTISSLDLSSLNTSSATTMGNMFYKAKIDSLKLFDETNPSESLFKTDNVTEMAGMFRESNIPSIDASKFNTAKVKDFSGMFMSASATTIDVSGWNTESATDFTNTFANIKLTSLDLSHFNTKKVKSMLGMFDGTVKMENLNVSGWDNESLTTVGYMFRGCGRNVTNGATINLAGFTTPKVKSMNLMFSGSGFTSLDLGSFSSAELTDMSNMFSQMGKIQSLSFGPDFTAEHVTNMYSAFAQMGRSMVNLDLSSLNASSVTNLNGAFASNSAVTIDLTGWDFSNVESANNTFYGANYIATIYASSDFPASLGGTSFAYGQPIKGGAGTTYISDENAYARIDDPDNNKPGYFTLKDAIYVKYHGNGSDDDSYEIMPSHYVSTAEPYDVKLKPNAFVKEGYKFMGWATSANSTTATYADGAALEGLTASKTPLELYAVWNKIEAIFKSNTSSTLDSIHASNSAASKFKKYPNGQPSDEILANATDVSSTDDPIWVWPDGENIYFWSEDELPAFPAIMSSFFHQTTLSEIDLNGTEANVTNMTWTFANTSTLKKVDLGNNFDTTNNTILSATFGNATNLETIIFGDKFTTKNVTTTDWMFNSTGKLKTADVASFDVSKVQNMVKMFVGCGLENLDLSSWSTPALKGPLDGTFSSGAIKSITFGQGFDTSNVTSMSGTFAGIKATSLDISMFNTEKVTTMASMFSSSAMTSLDLSNFSSAALTNMSSMFYGMSNLTSITFGPNFTAEGVTNIASLFDGASSIEYLDLTDLHIPAQTSMNHTFMDMHKLKTLDITGWDLTHVTNASNAFANETVVETIYASSGFLPENLPSGGFEFGNWTLGGHLVGGAGTACTTNVSGVYARIDDPDNGEPGYFTPKDSIYIRYHDNDGDDTNNEANYALMPSYYVSTAEPYDVKLKTNAFEREHYKFMGWATSADGAVVYADGAALEGVAASKNPLDLYAVWKERTAILGVGRNVNTALKAINSNATAFEQYSGTPDLTQIDYEVDIAAATSNFPVYAWNDNGTIYWWSEAEAVYMNTDSSYIFQNLASITDIELDGLDSINVNDMSFMFDGCSSIEEIDVTPLNTANVTNMYAMFAHMTNLSSLDVSSLEMGNVENVQSFAAYGSHLTELDLSSWDTSNFKNINWIVRDSAVKKLNLNGWNTNKVEIFDGFSSFFNSVEELNLSNWTNMNFTDMSNWFKGASNFKKINFTNFNTSEVTNMANMFNGTTGLTTLDLSSFNTSKVRDMSLMFYNDEFTTLDISNFNTSSLENMYGMFAGITNIEKLDLSMFNTSNVTNMRSVFNRSTIKELDLSSWNTSRVENMWMMFEECSLLEQVYVGDLWTTSSVTNSNAIFNKTSKLVGGSGTVWNSSMTHDLSYARIDDPDNTRPGLFTLKNARYIRYDANEPYGETATGQTQSHYASSVAPYTQVQTNGFAIDSYRFLGWGTSPDSVVVYEPGALIDDIVASKEPYTLYAKWEQVVPPTLMQSMLNDRLKEIVAAADATDNDVVAVKEATNPPAEQLIDDNIISSPESSYKIWAYYTEGTIWIYTEDGLTPHAPYMLGNMFSGFPNLTDVSWLSKLDISNTTDISSLFDQDTSLTDISPLANWDTSKLISILGTFRGTAISDLSPIATKNCGDKTCWDTSSLEEMSSAFQGMMNLSDLSPLATWNASKLNDLSFAFYDTSSLTDFSGISGWRLKETGGITMLMTFDNRNADYSVLENWFSERANGTEGITMSSTFPNINAAKLPSWAQ